MTIWCPRVSPRKRQNSSEIWEFRRVKLWKQWKKYKFGSFLKVMSCFVFKDFITFLKQLTIFQEGFRYDGPVIFSILGVVNNNPDPKAIEMGFIF